ncbi:MAG: SPFH domain-containing protein [Bacteroidota bacterium]
MDSAQIIGIAIFFGAIAILLLIAFIRTNVVICKPNEIVIISGRQRTTKDGQKVGYRILRGGRGFKWPFIESVSRLSLNTRAIKVNLSKVLCQGMIPVEIEGRANIKLAGRVEEGMENAIERFLGKTEDSIDKTAQQVIEGNLRGIMAAYSPEAANTKRIEVMRSTMTEARTELKNLGLVLDSFQILSIFDDHGHLEAIGRKRNAEVIRDARIAEARADAEARQVTAEQKKLGREAEITSELDIVKKENDLTITRYNLQAEENKANQQAIVAGDIARTQEKITLENLRVQLSAQKQEAETIIPAKAKKQAMELEAQGVSARILEDGKATAKAVELMLEQWQDGNAHDLFMIRMLPDLFDKATRVIADNLHIEKLTILDGGEGGEGVPNYVQNLTNSAVTLIEQLKNATGVDLTDLAKNNKNNSRTIELPPENK